MSRLNYIAKLALVIGLSGCGVITPPGNQDLGTAGGDMATTGASWKALYGDYFSNCAGCHAPGAPGRTSDTEMTLNFTSAATSFTSVTTGKASGLKGNFAGCNGASFITPGAPAKSLLVAILDAPTRQAFDLASAPTCTKDAISDMVAKIGTQPLPSFVASLKTWITNNAPNN